MRYHYEKPDISVPMYGDTYVCDHPVYFSCTLYKIGDLGLSVIQQRYRPDTKTTWWGMIDRNLRNELYLNPGKPSLIIALFRARKLQVIL